MGPTEVVEFAATLCDAIRERQVLLIRYGATRAPRRVEPYCLGLTQTGEALLLAWQVLGSSASDTHAGWKYFALVRIRDTTGTGDHFERRADFAGAVPPLVDVICEIADGGL